MIQKPLALRVAPLWGSLDHCCVQSHEKGNVHVNSLLLVAMAPRARFTKQVKNLGPSTSPTHASYSFLASSPASPQPPASLSTASPTRALLHCRPFSILLLISHVALELHLDNFL